MKNKVFELLEKLKKEVPGNSFTGTGIIIYDDLSDLPIFNMSKVSELHGNNDVYTTILESSLATNTHHDGFNMINNEFKITHRNVYFAPPVDFEVKFDNESGFGTRYVAALLGSKVKGVLLTAVVSNSYGIVVFENGSPVLVSK
ncbi:diadenylate cyclase [Vibrio sp. G41H]|uniref:diadenylate cyclase n=1 Tax=unclassified Vibrio TaxID=2614977 RepID=UPI001AD61BF1|nr:MULTISPECIES: diadenylate cyclase [unclassified Vibrio]MBO7912029.1 diadenylate cyclase [Vibrio sp. G41H]MCF7491600.1 diadenylate cyclase [Vibrio sp. G-C-1]